MRQRAWVVALLVVAMAVGCKRTPEGDKVAQDTRQVVKSAGEYVHAQYVAAGQVALADMQKRIDELSVSAASAGDVVKADAQVKLQQLRLEGTRMRAEFDDLKNATDANWEAAKAAFEKSQADLNERILHARDWLSAR